MGRFFLGGEGIQADLNYVRELPILPLEHQPKKKLTGTGNVASLVRGVTQIKHFRVQVPEDVCLCLFFKGDLLTCWLIFDVSLQTHTKKRVPTQNTHAHLTPCNPSNPPSDSLDSEPREPRLKPFEAARREGGAHDGLPGLACRSFALSLAKC